MSSPLIEDLIDSKGLPLVDEASLEAFCASHRHVLLFFTENPVQFPESNDVAVVLPLLMQHFGERFRVGVVSRDSERQLHARFPFDSWPALVLLRDGRYVGAISRMQDWAVYLAEMERLLESEPSTLSGFKIPVVSADASPTCH
ncbi:MAG: hydrogenase-1 expression HyaE [Candidatus Thiodiazotropha sp.]